MSIIKDKATRLVVTGKVKRSEEYWFEVQGDTEIHKVKLSPHMISCDCRHFALHGCTKGEVCSHILAVVMFVITEKATTEMRP